MKKEELYKVAWRLWGRDMQLDILIEERFCAAKGEVEEE